MFQYSEWSKTNKMGKDQRQFLSRFTPEAIAKRRGEISPEETSELWKKTAWDNRFEPGVRKLLNDAEEVLRRRRELRLIPKPDAS